MLDRDVVVIGGGAAGLTAAREAARRDARVLLVSEGPLGGDCTHTGCVPSKTLLAAAAGGATFDDAMRTVHAAIETIAATEDESALRRDGVEAVRGRARLLGGGHVDVDGRSVSARHVVIATGARATAPPIAGLDDVGFLTNDSVFDLPRQPNRLAVIGGGPIGVELAQAFADLGTVVTLLEADDRLLPRDEPEASDIVAASLVRRGVDVRTRAMVERVHSDATGAPITLALPEGTIEVDDVLVATGRAAVTDGLGLDDAGVALDDRGHVRTDDTLATTADGVWAIGDVTGRMPFTHAAARMAFVAVQNALDRSRRVRRARFDATTIPWVTFTDPEVAHIGMTEDESAEHDGRVAFLPFDELDRAITAGRTEGFVKLIAGPRPVLRNAGGGRILGATVVGPTAGELIGEVALAMTTNMFTGRLAQATHAYPTWSMALQEAAAQFFLTYEGRAARPARG